MVVGNDRKAEQSVAPLPSLSRKESLILEILSGAGRAVYGLEMVEMAGHELKRGTVYVTLHRMQDRGLIESEPEARPAPEIGIPRRMYRITGLGQRVLDAYRIARSVFNGEIESVGA